MEQRIPCDHEHLSRRDSVNTWIFASTYQLQIEQMKDKLRRKAFLRVFCQQFFLDIFTMCNEMNKTG